MVGNPHMIVLESMNVVLSTPRVDPAVEEFCVCTTLFKVGQSSTLVFSCSLNHRQANHPPLESRAEVVFLVRKLLDFLSHVRWDLLPLLPESQRGLISSGIFFVI